MSPRLSPGRRGCSPRSPSTVRSIRLTRPESTLLGPTSTKVLTPSSIRPRAAWVKRTGAVSCSTSSDAKRWAGSIFAVTVDMNGATGSRNCTRSIAGRKPIGCAGDERAVERARDLQLDRAPRAELLGLRTDLVHGVLLAGDDDLARAVVVRRPDALDVLAEPLDDRVIETEDRGHRAVADARRLGHRKPALAHERDRLGGGHRQTRPRAP